MTDKEPTEIVKQPESVLAIISRVAADPRLDVEKLSRLLDLQERVMAEQRKTEFIAALVRLAPKLPHIKKNGTITYDSKRTGEHVETKYALLEDIDTIIRPLLAEEGLSQSYDSKQVADKIEVTVKVSHQAGHSETRTITLPVDLSGAKNGAQGVKSTISYGRRILTQMFFNLIEEGTDTDGNNTALITEEQVLDIEAQIAEVKFNRELFLRLMAVSRLEEIQVRDMPKVRNAFAVRREQMARQGK